MIKVHPQKTSGCYFKKLDGNYLITNDWGYYAFLKTADFRSYLEGSMARGGSKWGELRKKGFIRDHLDFDELARSFGRMHLDGPGGPVTHTVEVTRRCDFKCLYCSANVRGVCETGFDMSLDTARRVVDFIFSSAGPEVQIEFQGGEPLLNYDVVRFIITYAGKKNEIAKKRLSFSLITNFSTMDTERLDFLARQGVNLCTSLDGPRDIHDACRISPDGSSHEVAAVWLRGLYNICDSGLYTKMSNPNAVATVTRFSLAAPERVVDEFLRLGVERIQLGPLDSFGFAKNRWKEVGYTAREFLSFYERALDHIIELGRYGGQVYEKGAAIFLRTILRREPPLYRGEEVFCQLAYGFDGSIYPSDEGRLLAASGDDSLRLGNVFRDGYCNIAKGKLALALFLWNCRAAVPLCSRCVWSPFCQVARVPPALNRVTQGTFWGHFPSNDRCKIYQGVFNILFNRIKNRRTRNILDRWLDYP